MALRPSTVLAPVRELLQLFLPRLVRLAAAGTNREEKYTPSTNRLLGVRPRHWGYLLVLSGLVVSLLEAAAGESREEALSPQGGRLKCAHLVSWGAALFSDPLSVTLVYLFRVPMAYVDYALRRGLVPPSGNFMARELFVTLVALFELWWRHWRFESAVLPGFARQVELPGGEEDAGGGRARSLRKYTVMFRVSEHTTSSEVERLLQRAEGHFPLPRRWDKRSLCGTEWAFLEYEDVGTQHSGKEQLICKVARHPTRKKMYAGVGLATIREIEETYRVDIPTERIKLEPEHVVFTIFGYSLAECESAAKQLRAIAPLESKVQPQIREGNAFSRGKRAEEVLRKGGLHVAIREGGNHGGITGCMRAYADALTKGSHWAASVPAPRRPLVVEKPAQLWQKDGYDSVSAYRALGGPITRMLLNGTRVEVMARQESEGCGWLQVRLQGGPDDGHSGEDDVVFVKRHNVVGSTL